MQIDVPKIKLQWGIIEFLIDAFVHDAIANNQRGDLQVGFKNIHPNARVPRSCLHHPRKTFRFILYLVFANQFTFKARGHLDKYPLEYVLPSHYYGHKIETSAIQGRLLRMDDKNQIKKNDGNHATTHTQIVFSYFSPMHHQGNRLEIKYKF